MKATSKWPPGSTAARPRPSAWTKRTSPSRWVETSRRSVPHFSRALMLRMKSPLSHAMSTTAAPGSTKRWRYAAISRQMASLRIASASLKRLLYIWSRCCGESRVGTGMAGQYACSPARGASRVRDGGGADALPRRAVTDLEEEARDVDDEVGAASAADHVHLAIAAEGDDAAVGHDLAGQEPVDRGVARPYRAGREEAEEARGDRVGHGQVVDHRARGLRHERGAAGGRGHRDRAGLTARDRAVVQPRVVGPGGWDVVERRVRRDVEVADAVDDVVGVPARDCLDEESLVDREGSGRERDVHEPVRSRGARSATDHAEGVVEDVVEYDVPGLTAGGRPEGGEHEWGRAWGNVQRRQHEAAVRELARWADKGQLTVVAGPVGDGDYVHDRVGRHRRVRGDGGLQRRAGGLHARRRRASRGRGDAGQTHRAEGRGAGRPGERAHPEERAS